MEEEFDPYWSAVQTLVLKDETLSDAAFRLYTLINNKTLTPGYCGYDNRKMCVWLQWTTEKTKKALKELITKGWIIEFDVERLGPKLFTQPNFMRWADATERKYAGEQYNEANPEWLRAYGTFKLQM